MGIAHDLGLIGEDGDLDAIIVSVTDTDDFADACADLHRANTRSSTAYLLARVDFMQNRLYVSADAKVMGVFMPNDPKVTAALVSSSPVTCMAELFSSQHGWTVRLYFHPSLVP